MAKVLTKMTSSQKGTLKRLIGQRFVRVTPKESKSPKERCTKYFTAQIFLFKGHCLKWIKQKLEGPVIWPKELKLISKIYKWSVKKGFKFKQ